MQRVADWGCSATSILTTSPLFLRREAAIPNAQVYDLAHGDGVLFLARNSERMAV